MTLTGVLPQKISCDNIFSPFLLLAANAVCTGKDSKQRVLGTGLVRADGDPQADLHGEHLSSRQRFEVRSDGEAEGLGEMLGQPSEFGGVGRLGVHHVLRPAAVADKEQLRPAYHVLFADVVGRRVDAQAVDAVQRLAVDRRLHAAGREPITTFQSDLPSAVSARLMKVHLHQYPAPTSAQVKALLPEKSCQE